MCPKCSSTKFAVATDKSRRHYCAKCQNVWIPGHEANKSPEVLLLGARAEINELRLALSRMQVRLDATEKKDQELFE